MTHADLLDDYCVELRAARDEVQIWWANLRSAEGSRGAPDSDLRIRWPAGPASHPRIVAIFRKYFLACDALNEQILAGRDNADQEDADHDGWGKDSPPGPPGPIPPARLLLDGLDAKDCDLQKFMESFVFMPIGIDLHGETA